MEKTFGDNFCSERVRQTISSSAYSLVTITKIIFLKYFLFLLLLPTPITEALHDPEISVTNNSEFISAVLSRSIVLIGT